MLNLGAGAQGFEPQLTDPESAVLPLDDAPLENVPRNFSTPAPSCQTQNTY